MLITESQGYKLFCETRKVEYPADTYHIRVFTTYEWSKNPEATQNRIELFLTHSELEKFKSTLTV